MPDRPTIYKTDPQTYDLLISKEDCEGNLLKTLKNICDFQNKDIADIGAGTGRLSMLLAPFIRSALLTDDADPMLKLAAKKLGKNGFDNFKTYTCDLGTIPAEDCSLDIVLAGWTLCSKAFRSELWEQSIKNALSEMERVLRPTGTIIIMESLGTGQEHPSPPNQRFGEYFQLLESEAGFNKISIRTDYLFESIEEKERLLTFFFDKDMLESGIKNDLLTYPECTGIWWKRAGTYS